MQVRPYLFFDGRCEETLAFYKAALSADAGARLDRMIDAIMKMKKFDVAELQRASAG